MCSCGMCLILVVLCLIVSVLLPFCRIFLGLGYLLYRSDFKRKKKKIFECNFSLFGNDEFLLENFK